MADCESVAGPRLTVFCRLVSAFDLDSAALASFLAFTAVLAAHRIAHVGRVTA